MTDKAPLASVLIATYRRREVLERSIRSVLAQTLSELEVIVVDDEPSDATRILVEGIGDSRLQYVAHDRNRGLCAARNTGLRLARGQFVAFLDDDDMFLPQKLEVQLKVLDELPPAIGVASCFEEIVRRDGTLTTREMALDGDVYHALLRNDLIRMQPLLVRSECFDRVGLFDERLRGHDDYDMTLRLSRSFQFVTVREPLVRIYSTEGSMSTNAESRIQALQTIMSTHPEFRTFPRVRARWERRLARHYSELRNRKDWRRMMWRSLRSDPSNIVSWVTLLVGSVFGSSAHSVLGRLRGRVFKSNRLNTAREFRLVRK